MKTLLWLDDIRNPFDKDFTSYVALYNPFLNEPHKIVWVTNYESFTRWIGDNGLPDAISFDHDLDTEHYDQNISPKIYKKKTGYDCVKWLVEYCRKTIKHLPICIYHTMNPAGKVNMSTYIKSSKEHYGI